MNTKTKRVIAVLVASLIALATLAGCGWDRTTPEQKQREETQAQKSTGETLEKSNLARKKDLEENPNRIGYLYLYTFGQPMGYYIIKGKVSSNGSQRTPEQDIVTNCGGTSGYYGCSQVPVDGPQDDGSYGGHDPGIFFFLANGQMVVTSFDYIISDAPIAAADVPLLGGEAR